MAFYTINPPPSVPSRVRDRKERKVFIPGQKDCNESASDVTDFAKKSPTLITLDDFESTSKFSSDLEGLDLSYSNLGSNTLKKGLSNSLEDLSATSKAYPDISGLFYELKSDVYFNSCVPPPIGFSHFTECPVNLNIDQRVPLPQVSLSRLPEQTLPLPSQQQKPPCPFSPQSYQNVQTSTPFQYPSPAFVTDSRQMLVPSPLPWEGDSSGLFKERKPSLSNMHRPASLNDLDDIDTYPKTVPLTNSASATTTPIAETFNVKFPQRNGIAHATTNLIDLYDREYLNLEDFDPYRVEQRICSLVSSPQETSAAFPSKDKNMRRSESENDLLNCTSLLLEWSQVPNKNSTAQVSENDNGLFNDISFLQEWAETSDVSNPAQVSEETAQSLDHDYANSIVELSQTSNIIVDLPKTLPKEDNKPLDTIVPIQHYPAKKPPKDFSKPDIPPKSSSWTFLRKVRYISLRYHWDFIIYI